MPSYEHRLMPARPERVGRYSSCLAPRRTGVPVAIALLTLITCGCGRQVSPLGVPNQPPEVRLEPAGPAATWNEGARHLVSWSGEDPDGRVESYLVAINPRSLEVTDPSWSSTHARSRSVEVAGRARRPAGIAGSREGSGAAGRPFDWIAVRAVDDRGAVSDVAIRAFFDANVAPTVRIVDPPASPLLSWAVPPAFRILWEGEDPDGSAGIPVLYKYILLSAGSEFPLQIAIADPDSLRRFYAPDFVGWESVPGESTQVTFTNLTPGADYVFAITAIDEQGDYDPVFSLAKNLLRLRVLADHAGPRISVSSSLFHLSIAQGEYEVEIPPNAPFALRWSAMARPGTGPVEFRWVLDPLKVGLDGPIPRAGSGLHEFTAWSEAETSATIGPLPIPGRERLVIVEARDAFGFRSRFALKLLIVDAAFDRDLLIVDDTRFLADQWVGGCAQPPTGEWPTAAELDTFLFARGGTPWTCYPAGTVTPPGLFAGYDFDTIGTRTGQDDLTVPLDLLTRYRHVVWITDGRSANSHRPGSDPLNPMTALRYMSSPGRVNTLQAYMLGGGKVWLLGGGAATASLLPWDDRANNTNGLRFSNADGELVPGRLMYDQVHWRSEIRPVRMPGFVQRSPGAASSGGSDYTLLPPELRRKTPATDPLPPHRTASVFYHTVFDFEFLSLPNSILEGSPAESVLDSTYRVVTFALPPTSEERVCMTYYRGAESAPVVFSGFNVWSFSRADCQALVDFVLGNAWGLPKSPVAAEPRLVQFGR